MSDSLYTEAGLNRAVTYAHELGVELSDDVARAVAAAWHSGQGSAFYAFNSSGYCDRSAMLSELSDIIHRSYDRASAADRLALDMMGTYLINRETDADEEE